MKHSTKMVLDLAPLLLFVIAYQWRGIYAATVVLIVALYLSLLVERRLNGKWNPLLMAMAALATVLGGFTLALHDPAFIKLKPTLLYGLFALACVGSQWFGKQVLIQRLMGTALEMPPAVWQRLNLAWAAFFAFCAALNYYVAQHYAEATWVHFKLIGLTILPFAFALLQAPFLARYLPRDESSDAP
jgi:intracellular septation protein